MYQIPGLKKFPGLKHAISTVKDGNMANVILGNDLEPKRVLNNRICFLKKTGFDIDKTVCMWVIHGNDVVKAERNMAGISVRDREYAVKCDGLITNKKGLNLFLLVADCIPLVFFDPVRKVLGILHVSRINVEKHIIKNLIDMMKSDFGTISENILIGIGPSAKKETFKFENLDKLNITFWKKFITKNKDGKFGVDLTGLSKKLLIDSGIRPENISDCEVDTISDERFFSHYRDVKAGREDQGRFALVAGIK
jgi:polyphenol oxidase